MENVVHENPTQIYAALLQEEIQILPEYNTEYILLLDDLPTSTWDPLEETIAETKEKVLKGKTSPISYFMQKNLMNIHALARKMGKMEWNIRRHMNPSVFRTLNNKVLQKYAEVFNVRVEDLREFRG